MRPASYSVFKSKAALKFQPIMPKEDFKEGALMVEAANGTMKEGYNWSDKITFAVSVDELGKCLLAIEYAKEGMNPMQLFHDPNMKKENQGKTSKTFQLSCPKGPMRGMVLTLTQKTGQDKKMVSVGLSPSEVRVLKSLFEALPARLLGWELE